MNSLNLHRLLLLLYTNCFQLVRRKFLYCLEILKISPALILNIRKRGTRQNKTDIELSEELKDFKSNYPVNKIKLGDLYFWPILRHVLWVRLRFAYKGSRNVATVNPGRVFINKYWRKIYRENYGFSELGNVSGEKGLDFLFFTNLRGTEQTTIEGKIYNRVTDPIYEVAKEVGLSEKVEIIKTQGDVDTNRFFDPIYIIPPVATKAERYSSFSSPDDLFSSLEEKIPSAEFDKKSNKEVVEYFFYAKDMYKSLLIEKNPKSVFFVGYDFHFPLIMAAKELGVKSIDLQHGLQAGWSPSYNFWDEVPSNGYEVLPDYFWVWGEYDYKHISNTFSSAKSKAVIGGFPWMERQMEFSTRLPGLIVEKFDPGKLIGIITLQDQKVFPELFEDIVNSTQEKIVWVIKRHPKFRSINLKKVKNVVEGGVVDEVPFSAFLDSVDLHLTECSTSVVEADYFGVKNFVSGVQGFKNYSDFIHRGSVFHVDSLSSFINKVDSINFNKKKSVMNILDTVEIDKVLESIIR